MAIVSFVCNACAFSAMGELDEEMVNELGQTVPMREKVPIIVVPDLKDFKLKPYVSHK